MRWGWALLGALVLVLTIVVTGMLGPILASKAVASVATGVFLGTGFVLKDSILHHAKNWKKQIESNMETGKPLFHNPAQVEKWKWRSDPVKYKALFNEKLEEVLGNPEIVLAIA